MQEEIVEAGHRPVKNANVFIFGLRRIYQRAHQVEKGICFQPPAHRANIFKRRVKIWCMNDAEVIFLQVIIQLLFSGFKVITEMFQDIRRT